MANPLLTEILGQVLGGGRAGALPAARAGLPGSDAGGGLGAVLGGMLGGGLPGVSPMGVPRGGGPGSGHAALVAMLLPLAMRWVQGQGGLGGVLQRVGERGYGRQAASWLATGPNEPMPVDAVHEVLGRDALMHMSRELGVGEDEVAGGLAEILPAMVDHLSPDGQLPQDADQRLDAGQSALDRMLAGVR